MFRVYLVNFGYHLEGEYGTVDDAKEAGRKAGFQFVVVDRHGNHVYASPMIVR